MTSAKDIFSDALEVEPAQREAFIRSACEGDAALAGEVLGLISMHDRAKKFLSLPAVTGLPEEMPGAMIGCYKLRELIGEGGFGSVFLAEQEQPVRRRVALKIIKLGMDTRSVVARFEQERQALAMMDHPNIAKVLDAGATSNGRPYFVMELVKGDPITTYADGNHLTIEERLGLFTQVCSAVHHAHMKGVIHRDLKPSNILVSTQDGRAHARIIDFGIAKATAQRLTDKTVFTEFRNFIGTPEYMSPEQAEGTLDIDTRTDVYSLGVLLYELLTGTTPFDGKRLRSAAFAEVQRIIREDDPPKPSTRLQQSADTLAGVAANRRVEPARLNTQVRGELDWIVMKALDKDRARRYGSPGELAADIERHLIGEAVSAAPPTRMYRVRKLVSRNRGIVVAGLLIGVTLTAGAVGMSLLAMKESRARARAEEAEKATRRQADELERVATFQSAQLKGMRPDSMAVVLREELVRQVKESLEKAKAPPEQIEADLTVLRALLARPNLTNVAVKLLDDAIIDRSVKAVNDQFADQPLVRARLLHTLAGAMLSLGLFEQASGPQAEALAIRREHLGNEHSDTVESITGAAALARKLGRTAEAAALYEEAYTTSRRALGNDQSATLVAVVNMSTLRMDQGKLAEAEKLQREAIEMSKRIYGAEDTFTAGTMANLAFNLGQHNKLEEAVGLMEGALKIRRKARGDDHPETVESVNNLGFMLLDAGRGADAERLFREAYEARRRLLGDEHLSTLFAQNNIGSALRGQGKYLEAEAVFRQNWEARKNTLGPLHPDTLTAVSNLAASLADLGRRADALPLHREAYEGRLRLLGPDDPNTLSSMANYGFVLNTLSKFEEAEPYLRGAYEGRLRTLGPTHSDTLSSMQVYATLLMHQGELGRAEELCVEVVARRRASMGPKHQRTLGSITLLGRIRREQKRLSEAEASLKEAMEGFGSHPLGHESRYWHARTLMEMSRFEEAENEVLSLETELRARPSTPAAAMNRAVELIVDIYESWDAVKPGTKEKAASWRAKLTPGGQ